MSRRRIARDPERDRQHRQETARTLAAMDRIKHGKSPPVPAIEQPVPQPDEAA
jgi:hypothetical protein